MLTTNSLLKTTEKKHSLNVNDKCITDENELTETFNSLYINIVKKDSRKNDNQNRKID